VHDYFSQDTSENGAAKGVSALPDPLPPIRFLVHWRLEVEIQIHRAGRILGQLKMS
jgi:hypothetical protein